jgi:hypothetical protein
LHGGFYGAKWGAFAAVSMRSRPLPVKQIGLKARVFRLIPSIYGAIFQVRPRHITDTRLSDFTNISKMFPTRSAFVSAVASQVQ